MINDIRAEIAAEKSISRSDYNTWKILMYAVTGEGFVPVPTPVVKSVLLSKNIVNTEPAAKFKIKGMLTIPAPELTEG